MEDFMYGAAAAAGWSEGRWRLGSTLATAMFFLMTLRRLFPHFFDDRSLRRWAEKLVRDFYPYVEISFPEHSSNRFTYSAAFRRIESYLSATRSGAARRLRGEFGRGSSKLVLSMDENQEVIDRFEGISIWWHSSVSAVKSSSTPFFFALEEKRSYRLTFHRRHRRLVEEKYLSYVMQKGKEIAAGRRQRWLFTNSSSVDEKAWSHVLFEHPARFETLAMDPRKKEELVKDLLRFRERKEYYARVGKAWKRGYLLYGPPRTGKSSLIAAMANLLEYDVYDLELTAVKDNSSLRRLLLQTSGKSIIVVEDIDCSVDLAGRRKNKEDVTMGDKMMGRETEESSVTLSGLLNFIDGLWSVCGGERIIVFTTNHLEKLDPALIRRGRMDVHLELSYCRFEGFKVLAKNYLGIEEHELFDRVKGLIEEVDITPADVAEVLMAGSHGDNCVEECLQALRRTLEEKKRTVVAEIPPESCQADEPKP